MKTVESLDALLASFGPNALKTGRHLLDAGLAERQRPVLLSQVAALDDVSGGLKRGSLIEVVGEGSSGRFSLELAVLAAATSAGENTAIIDWGDHFDPCGAEQMGVQLDRLFWVRPYTFNEALKSTEIVLTAGFRLVVLDLGVRPSFQTQRSEAAWRRFAREAKDHDSIVMIVSPIRLGSGASDVVIETINEGESWSNSCGRWRLFEGLSLRLRVLRERGGAHRQNHLSLPARDKI